MQQLVPNPLAMWEPRFRANANSLLNGPVRNRRCTDPFCLLILMLFVGGAIYLTYQGYHGIEVFTSSPGYSIYYKIGKRMASYVFEVTHKNIIWTMAIGMGLISIMLGFLFLLMLQRFPRMMIWASLLTVTGFLLAVIGVLLYKHQFWTAFGLTIFIGLFLWLIAAWISKIEAIVVIVKLTSEFIFNNCSIYLIPVGVALLSLVVAIFMSMGIVSAVIRSTFGHLSSDASSQLIASSTVVYVFFLFMIYYVMTFVIASAVASWFYQQSINPICAGWMGAIIHLGSLTFASVVILILRIIRALIGIGTGKAENVLSSFCCGMLDCCGVIFDGLIQVMNHLSVIVMAITGEDFMDSARTGAVIFFTELPLFAVLSTVDSAVTFAGVLFTTFVPTVIALGISTRLVLVNYEIVFIIVPAFFGGLVIGSIFLATFSESMTSLFVFYALEKKLVQYGLRAPSILPDQRIVNADQIADADLRMFTPRQMLDLGYPIVAGYYDR